MQLMRLRWRNIRAWLVWLAAVAGVLEANETPRAAYTLFAHRGGVVEDRHPDNSAAALRAAAALGYAGVEVDVRETKDGVLVMRHDPDLQLHFGDPRQLADLTWAELGALRSQIPGHRIWSFDEVVRAARDSRLRLMLDVKDPHSPDLCRKLESILLEHDMLQQCCIIGTRDALEYFVGKAPVGLKFGGLKARLEADPDASRHYFLFDEGRMTGDMVRWAQARGVKVVPSINVYHYFDAATMTGKSREELAPVILAAAHRDVEKFQALGVTEFQIDSEFDRWFGVVRPAEATRTSP